MYVLSKSGDMSVRYIHNVYVISYARVIGSIVVCAKNLHKWPLADSHLCHVGYKVIGDPLRILTDPPAWMGTNRIEIPQQ